MNDIFSKYKAEYPDMFKFDLNNRIYMPHSQEDTANWFNRNIGLISYLCNERDIKVWEFDKTDSESDVLRKMMHYYAFAYVAYLKINS